MKTSVIFALFLILFNQTFAQENSDTNPGGPISPVSNSSNPGGPEEPADSSSSAANEKLQALWEDFNKIPDQLVKDASNNFRAELKSSGSALDFEQLLNSPAGDCFYQFAFDFPYIFVKVGNGTITSGDGSVAAFQELFGQFAGCMNAKNIPIPDALKGAGPQAAALVKKYAEQLIVQEQNAHSGSDSTTDSSADESADSTTDSSAGESADSTTDSSAAGSADSATDSSAAGSAGGSADESADESNSEDPRHHCRFSRF